MLDQLLFTHQTAFLSRKQKSYLGVLFKLSLCVFTWQYLWKPADLCREEGSAQTHHICIVKYVISDELLFLSLSVEVLQKQQKLSLFFFSFYYIQYSLK